MELLLSIVSTSSSIFLIILRISTTNTNSNFKLTLVRTRSHVVLLLRVFEDTLGAEHLVAVLTKELNLLVLMNIAVGHNWAFRQLSFLCFYRSLHGQCCKNCVVDRQGVCRVLVDCLVERALYLVVLANLCRALVTKGVAAGVRERLLFLVVVTFVAYLAVKD